MDKAALIESPQPLPAGREWVDAAAPASVVRGSLTNDGTARSAPAAQPAKSPPRPVTTVLLHIGYHKTGTTWLQKSVFEDRSSQSPFLQPWNAVTIDELVMPHTLHFDPEKARGAFAAGFEAARSAGRLPVLSAERLSGNPHSGGYDSAELARRLALVFPEARILMVVREQVAAILSGYRQYVMVGGPCSLRRYLEPPAAGRARVPWFRFEHFEYDRLVSHYRMLFGPDNVLVLTHEQLVEDPVQFVDRIYAHAGLTRPANRGVSSERLNSSASDLVLALKRPINNLFVRDSLNPGGLIDSQRFSRRLQVAARLLDRTVPRSLRHRLHARSLRIVRNAVGDRYAASNRRLTALINTDLGALGYPV